MKLIDFDSIKYFVQIPLSWFKSMQDLLYKSYGTDFIKVNVEGYHGGLEIGINDEYFTSRVKEIAGDLSSTVQTVDEIEPDTNGNINFNLESNSWLKSDLNGHISTTDENPITVPETNGFLYNTNGSVTTVSFGTTSGTVADGGDLQNVSQSAQEALEIALNSEDSAQTASRMAQTASQEALNALTVANGKPDIGTGSTNAASGNHGHGNITNEGKFSAGALNNMICVTDNSGYITALWRNEAPVTKDKLCLTNEDNAFSTQQTFNSGLKTATVASDGNLTLQASPNNAQLQNQPTDTSEGSLAIATCGYVQQYCEGGVHTPNKWVKTDSDGKITTTDDVPITAPSSNGFLYKNNGSITSVSFGTTSGTVADGGSLEAINQTAQTASQTAQTASQTAQTASQVASNALTVANGKPNIGTGSTNAASGDHGHGNITNAGKLSAGALNNMICVTDNSGYITALYRNGSSVTHDKMCLSHVDNAFSTQQTFNSGLKTATVASDGNLTLQASPNNAQLQNQPTDTSEGSLAIATCGYVQSKCNKTYSASKWMKTDSDGKASTTDDTPIALPSGKTGQTTTITNVKSVTWSGTAINIVSQVLTFTNGCLTSVGADSTSLITTVTY